MINHASMCKQVQGEVNSLIDSISMKIAAVSCSFSMDRDEFMLLLNSNQILSYCPL